MNGRRVLVMSAGSGPVNNLMRSLKHADGSTVLVGCHTDRFILSLSQADRKYLLPEYDPLEEASINRFDQALRSVIALAEPDLLVPGNDLDSWMLAALQERRRFSCNTLLPSSKVIDLCQDKYALNQLLERGGVAVPKTYAVLDKDSLFDAWRKLAPSDLAWCRLRSGYASRGATMVRDPAQAWEWVSYWHVMRGVAVSDFTLSEFLPGRDYNVQGLWLSGKLIIIKMCERLSYLNAGHNPSGMSSTPALAKTVFESVAIRQCEAALQLVDSRASGVFNFDLKENDNGVPCITEINAGRFAMITNIYDLIGAHSLAGLYVRMACGEPFDVGDPYSYCPDHYLIRELDTQPAVVHKDQLFVGIERLN